MIKFLIVLLSFYLPAFNVSAEPLVLKYFQSDSRYEYRIQLLKLAMDLTIDIDGPYTHEAFKQEVSPKRGLIYLEAGKEINVAFLAASVERENRFLSVKIPILRGLLGYRISIIRKDNNDEFSKINSLEALRKKYYAGFGAQWADMAILKHNFIPVVGSASYNNLFTMLENNRFQYFPRGINEPWKELEVRKNSHPNLMIEPNIALYYPYPVYFYVNKNDVALADRIERGLKIALANGMFKELFLAYHKDLIKKSHLAHRKMFRLENKTLPKNVMAPDTSWWLQ